MRAAQAVQIVVGKHERKISLGRLWSKEDDSNDKDVMCGLD